MKNSIANFAMSESLVILNIGFKIVQEIRIELTVQGCNYDTKAKAT